MITTVSTDQRNATEMHWLIERVQFFFRKNPHPHVATTTLQRLHELGYEILPDPSYSLDISPTDYHLFKSFNHFLNQKWFTSKDTARNA